jgi:hypothetical protein
MGRDRKRSGEEDREREIESEKEKETERKRQTREVRVYIHKLNSMLQRHAKKTEGKLYIRNKLQERITAKRV